MCNFSLNPAHLVGSLAQTRSPNGVVTDYDYDTLNRLDLLRNFNDDGDHIYETDQGATDVLLSEFNYDVRADGKRTGVSEKVTDGSSTEETRVDWLYDNIGRLTQEVFNQATGDTLDFTADYLFDLVGNRLEKSVDNTDPAAADEVITYTYDANDRLLTETKDADGTADDSHTVYKYGDTNEKTQQTKKSVWPNLTGTGDESAITDYTYNLQGRMDSADVDLDADGYVDRREEYEYDDSGIRVAKTEKIDSDDDGTVDTTIRTDYHVDKKNHTGYAQVLEEMLNGTLERTYTVGHDVFAETIAVGQIRHLLKDGHASTRQLVDATGAVINSGTAQIFAHDAYGVPIGFDPVLALTSLLYNAEQLDKLTGLQYLRARYYDLATGRFNRLDPFSGNNSDPQSLHKYLYVHGDPVDGIDPTGRNFTTGSLMVGMSIGVALGSYSAYTFRRAGRSATYGSITGAVGWTALFTAWVLKTPFKRVAFEALMAGGISTVVFALNDRFQDGEWPSHWKVQSYAIESVSWAASYALWFRPESFTSFTDSRGIPEWPNHVGAAAAQGAFQAIAVSASTVIDTLWACMVSLSGGEEQRRVARQVYEDSLRDYIGTMFGIAEQVLVGSSVDYLLADFPGIRSLPPRLKTASLAESVGRFWFGEGAEVVV